MDDNIYRKLCLNWMISLAKNIALSVAILITSHIFVDKINNYLSFRENFSCETSDYPLIAAISFAVSSATLLISSIVILTYMVMFIINKPAFQHVSISGKKVSIDFKSYIKVSLIVLLLHFMISLRAISLNCKEFSRFHISIDRYSYVSMVLISFVVCLQVVSIYRSLFKSLRGN